MPDFRTREHRHHRAGRPTPPDARDHPHLPRRGHRSEPYGERRFARDPLDDDGARGGHRHGRRRRLFDYGDLRFILLRMIAGKPAHGYDLIKALEERMGGGYSPSPGVIYPTLSMLEEQGFATVTAEAGKKLYRPTEDGLAYLRANQAAVEAIEARIGSVAAERTEPPPATIVRAMENLRTALRLRLRAGPIEPERATAIAAAIDAAALEAERT